LKLRRSTTVVYRRDRQALSTARFCCAVQLATADTYYCCLIEQVATVARRHVAAAFQPLVVLVTSAGSRLNFYCCVYHYHYRYYTLITGFYWEMHIFLALNLRPVISAVYLHAVVLNCCFVHPRILTWCLIDAQLKYFGLKLNFN